MKNKELYSIINEINKGDLYSLKGVDFILTLSRNVKRIEQELEILDGLRKPTEKYKEFARKVSDLRAKFADKDPAGNPITRQAENGMDVYVITNMDEYNKAIKELENDPDNSKLIKEQNEKNKMFEEAIEKKCKIEFDKVSKADVPVDINFRQIYLLVFMIDD